MSNRSLWELASNNSLWRGYDYFRQEKVVMFTKLADEKNERYECFIKGSADKPYHTVIDIAHPKRSRCNCPFAEGRRVICKHMVALYFTVFPNKVDDLMRAVEESEEEEKRRLEEHDREIQRYVKSLKKEQLQRELYDALIQLEERNRRW